LNDQGINWKIKLLRLRFTDYLYLNPLKDWVKWWITSRYERHKHYLYQSLFWYSPKNNSMLRKFTIFFLWVLNSFRYPALIPRVLLFRPLAFLFGYIELTWCQEAETMESFQAYTHKICFLNTIKVAIYVGSP